MEYTIIREWFPQIDQISKEELRNKTLAAFSLAMERGGWTEETVIKAPVSATRPNCDVLLLEHIRDVTDVVIMAYDRLAKYYIRHNSPIDGDMVICGALLHDLGKFIEYSPKQLETAHANGGVLLRHPLTGAMLAQEIGLPEEVIHIIATHSFEGDNSYRTAASDFVRDLDMFVFRSSVYGM